MNAGEKLKISRTSVGLAVRAARQAARLSLLDISKKTGISISALSRIETGLRSLDFIEASMLAHELNVDLEHFKDLAVTYEKNGISEKIGKHRELMTDLRRAEQLALLVAIEAAA